MIKFEGDMALVMKQTAEFFTEYKKKAVFNTVLTAKPVVSAVRGDARIIEFYDGRVDPPFLVGKMWWDGDGYVVESSRIRNEKFAKWNSQYHTKTTTDIKRAVKNALEFVKPFSWNMVASLYSRDVKNALRDWVYKPHERIREAIAYTINRNDLHQEIESALKEGRSFVSDGMNKAKQVMQENIEESTRRIGLGLEALFMTVDSHGRYISDIWSVPKQESDLPEDVLTKIGLLKIMDLEENDQTKTLDEVGLRIGKNVFWVFTEADTIKKLSDKPEA